MSDARERAVKALTGWCACACDTYNIEFDEDKAAEAVGLIEGASVALVDAAELERLRETAMMARTAISRWDSLTDYANDLPDTLEGEAVDRLFWGLFMLAYYALHPEETPEEDAAEMIKLGREVMEARRG